MPIVSSTSPTTEAEVLGTPGEDIRRGLPGLDTLIMGLGSNDTLLGRDGDDVLIGGAGNDVVRGDEGADTFVFTQVDGSRDDLKDFSLAEGDKLEFRGILQGYDGGDLSGYLRFVKAGTLSRIEVDPTGSGTNFQEIAIVRNGRSLTLEDLVNDGAILVTDVAPLATSQTEVLGTPGEDILRGLPGIDTLIRGLGGEDKLFGQDGDDVLISGPGGGPVHGGEGADTFVFTEARPTSILDLKDFNLAEGDKLEFRGLFQGFEYEAGKDKAGHLSDYFGYLRLVKDGTVSRIEIDPTGNGTDFQAIAIIRNGRSLTLEDLFDADAIKVTQTFPNVIAEGNDVPIFYLNSRSDADPEALTVDGSGDLFINFVSSETSLDNVLGIYRIEDGEIGETQIFEDFEHSGPHSLDALFGGVDPGDQFGLFLVSDGQSDDALNSFATGAPWDIYFGFEPTNFEGVTPALTWVPPCGPLGGPEGPVCPPGDTVELPIIHTAIGGYRGEQYLIGFEDYIDPGSDFDFNDYVVSVERSASVPVDLSGETAGIIINLEEQGYNYAAKVLPVGDSLTFGFIARDIQAEFGDLFNAGFRGPLFDLFVESGNWIDFVGPYDNTDGDPSLLDPDHAGSRRRELSSIVDPDAPNDLAELLSDFEPDVTLLLAGINDIRYAMQAQGTGWFTDWAGLEALGNNINAAIDQFANWSGTDQSLVISTLAPIVRNNIDQTEISADLIDFYNFGANTRASIPPGSVPPEPVWDARSIGPGIINSVGLRQIDGINPYNDDGSNRLDNLYLFSNPVSADQIAFNDPLLQSTDGLHWSHIGYQLYAESLFDRLEEAVGFTGGTLGDTEWKTYAGNDATGGSGGDRLIGNDEDNVLDGGAGNDLLEGKVGADTFVFQDDFGMDIIADFSLAEGDVLRFDDALWTNTHGTLSAAEVIDEFSSVNADGNVVLTFADGEMVTLEGVTTTIGLAAALELF